MVSCKIIKKGDLYLKKRIMLYGKTATTNVGKNDRKESRVLKPSYLEGLKIQKNPGFYQITKQD